jgi:two-component system NtrC family response regulator
MGKTAMPLIFIVEDERKMTEIFKLNFSDSFNISYFSDAESALREIDGLHPALIVTDVRLPGMDGISFMEKVKKAAPALPFIVFTGYGSIDHAVETMKKGAFDYLAKPINIAALTQSIKRALSYIEIERSSPQLQREYTIRIDDMDAQFVTHDPATIDMVVLSQKASQFDSPILISGETGTGKELVARYIHQRSNRKGNFVKLNCASIPRDILEGELFGYTRGAFTGASKDYEGKIALSGGGTLFLDEIGELPLELQAKLLHVLETPEYYPLGSNVKKTVDLHLISASNRNLRSMVDAERFRRDLYYRVAVIPISIPPLRERRNDILPLVDYFFHMRHREIIVSPASKLKLLEYSWPGNVRELFNVLERSALMAKNKGILEDVIIDAEQDHVHHTGEEVISDTVPVTWDAFKRFKSADLKARKEELERLFVQRLLIEHSGNVSVSARSAGIDRRQFQDMIKSLGIDTSLYRES